MIHSEVLGTQQQPIPYVYVRPSDVVWATVLWKTIDLNEDFNQYIYFPLDQEDRSGKKSLAYVIWEAMERSEIPIYEDDELKVPIDNELFVARYTKADTIQLEIGYDEDDNELYQTVIVPKYFDGAEVYQYYLREIWFIDKQNTGLDSRRLALAPTKDIYVTLKSSREEIYMGHAPLCAASWHSTRPISTSRTTSHSRRGTSSSYTNTTTLTSPAKATDTTALSATTPQDTTPYWKPRA